MLRVWVDSRPVGTLDRMGKRGSSFSYDPGVPPELAVSMSMPFQVPSYDIPHDLLPLFDMNLPEGALRERLRLRFAKATGTFDEIDVLTITGRSQIGRVRLTPDGAALDDEVPFQSIDEILRARRGGDLYEVLMDTFARHSGLSGVQPKAMVAGETVEERSSPSLRGATHIVKFWDQTEYPELAANEFFCLSVAKAAGMRVPDFSLSDSGEAIVIERFDRRADGTYLGFEDMCVLNGATSRRKYEGGYETKLFKRVSEYLPFASQLEASRELFKLMILNCAVRNGDAHLKNFGMTYDSPGVGVEVAPVYDVVTTCAYLPTDRMALTMNGSTDWPNRKRLQQFGQARAKTTPSGVVQVMENVADAMSDVAVEARAYFSQCPHPEVGDRMLAAWETGIRTTLGLDERTLVASAGIPSPSP